MTIASYEICYSRKLPGDLTSLVDLESTLLYDDNMGAIATGTGPEGDGSIGIASIALLMDESNRGANLEERNG